MATVIVGAGLAGLAAGHRLARAGHDVVVLEAGPVIGGRTASWLEDGMPVESGLHRFLGVYLFLFCTHLILSQCLFQHLCKAPRHDFLVHAIF